MFFFFFLITFLSLLVILSNDIELNPGPRKDSSNHNFSIAYWNINSNAKTNFVKSSHLEIYNTIDSYDLICFSETWSDSMTSIDFNDLSLKSYNLYRVDEPVNVRKGGVIVYYKENIAFHFLQTKLDQCNFSDITKKAKNKKKCHLISFFM